MIMIRFDFGSAYNEYTKNNADSLVEKINDLLERFGLDSEVFFNEILQHTVGFYVSSSNMNRKPEERFTKQGRKIVKICNFFFRLELDDYASNLLDNNTILLKGDLSFMDDERYNSVEVHDFYLAVPTDELDYEMHIQGSADYRNEQKQWHPYIRSNEITFELAEEVPFIVNSAKFNKFINSWREYLEFEKSVTIGSIKRHPIVGNINFQPVCEVIDNAVSRDKYDGYIITEGGGNLFVNRDSPKLYGNEPQFIFLSVKLDSKPFGNAQDDIIKKATSFARLGLSVIGEKQDKLLNVLLTELKKSDEERKKSGKDLPDIEGFDFDDWLTPKYDSKSDKVTFYFLVTDESGYRKGSDPKSEIEKFGKSLFLAYIATGDIALYKRGKDALDKIKSGDVKNPYLAGFIIEPENFENELMSFDESNVEFALKELNSDQKEAVIKCLNSNSIFLLQGPPGTGKTQTITELVYQFNKMGKKVLLSSQTHIAIDNVIERLPKELNILPIRLVRDRSKANAQYLPEKLLDNLYDAAYYKYRGKIDAHKSYEKNINELLRMFESNKSRYENIKARLVSVKNMEEKRNQLIKELSEQRSQENEIESELTGAEHSLSVFAEYARTKLPFESVLDEHVYEPILEPLGNLAKKYNRKTQDDFYNYATDFKRIAGKSRVEHLIALQKGGEKPKDLIDAENRIKTLQEKFDTFKEYGEKIPPDLNKRMNEALQSKKNIDRKYESSGKVFSLANEKFNFVKTDKDYAKNVIETELKAIENFVEEYNKILFHTFDKETFDKLSDEKDALNAKTGKIKDKIRTISAESQKIEADIKEQNLPIESERKTLEEYFVSFYTDKLNGVALPETEPEKFDEIRAYIEEEKSKFENYKADFIKLQDIYNSLADYLEHRQDFVKAQRNKYTKTLLKHNANVYGITCTSSPRFYPNTIVEKGIEVEGIDIRNIDFDVVIIDEVSKATPIEMLIPIIYGKSVVLVGDQRQLPPIFKYRNSMFDDKTPEKRKEMLQGKELEEYKKMVESSLFENIFNKLDHNRAMLTKQYRFNEAIMNCDNVFYDNKLTLGAGKEQNNKKQHYLDVSITNVKGGKTPVFCRKNSTYWFDSHLWADRTVAYSEVREGETSYRNPLEVKLTIELLLLLEKGYKELKERNPEEYKMAAGDGEKPSVAIITMYGKQIASIKAELKAKKMQPNSFKNIHVDISTVDNYQGKEQDIVLVNMVANTKNGQPGEFLKKFNRINVAISRARTMLIMVGSRTFYAKVQINVPNMDTGKANNICAYYRIYEKCESKWETAAGLFGINKEERKK
jgi:superfamily I DNA and/or RNA helicase